MRESNFAFPAQNRACVCISSQLYDRRALDTSAPLPLLNSLTHLTYLTSTSPRIREIMTQDGGLQRLVRLLVEFTTNPPAPSPNTIYGLSPPTPASFKSPALSITDGSSSLNFTGPYDKSAAHRFSLAFQSVVNIGVRGNEDIRARVVRAGTLDVVSSVLKAWLTARGFAVGPSSSATGVPRESREQRMARRAAASRTQAVEGLLSTTAAIGHPSRPDAPSGPRPERRRGERETTRETAHELQRALRRSIAANDIPTSSSATLPHPLPIAMPTPGLPQAQVRTRPELSAPPTSAGSSTTHSSASPSPPPAPPRSRSGTVTRPVAGPSNHHHLHPHTTPTSRQARHSFNRESTGSGSSADNSRAETETEDDENGDDTDTQQEDQSHGRARPQEENDAHIVISDFSTVDEAGGDPAAVVSHPGILGDGDMVHGMGGVGVGGQNDDFAMGAPPGAPGAIGVGTMNINITIPTRTTGGNGPVTTLDVAETPRARTQPLPMTMNIPAMAHPQHHHHHHHHHHPPLSHPQGNGIGKREGMYRDEDVLLALQLLAYLSKYPHVRQAFYKSRGEAPPAAIMISQAKKDDKEKKRDGSDYQSGHTGAGGDFFRAFLGRGHSHNSPSSSIPPSASSTSGIPTNSTSASSTQPTPPIRHTNVFSLVERFTFRPSSAETGLPNPPPKLPPEIQYWAGVIMRNACRKDESRGGVRQCANMLCGKWETYPREFAKCRRCRKAKYCGKECQSTAWSEGHRFWCNSREGDEEEARDVGVSADTNNVTSVTPTMTRVNNNPGNTATVRRTTVVPPPQGLGGLFTRPEPMARSDGAGAVDDATAMEVE